jgi:copper chaperone
MASQPTPAKLTFTVPGVSCAHCQWAITEELADVPAVTGVRVDLDTKLVTVTGAQLDETALRQAIEAAGYDVEP